MSNIVYLQEQNFAVRAVAASGQIINMEPRNWGWNISRILFKSAGAWTAIAALLVLSSAILMPAPAWSQATKTCGISGTPACLGPQPVPSPWLYETELITGYGLFDSLAQAEAIVPPIFLASGYCTYSITGSYVVGTPQTTYGQQTYVWNEMQSAYTAYEPQCGTNGTNPGVGAVIATRNITCPVLMSLSYQAGPPTVGPTCSLPSNTVNVLKAPGKPCNGAGGTAGGNGLALGNPCDVANGNKYEAETDYVGGGQNPLKFVRSYNSFSALFVGNSSQYGVAQQPIGVGWTATYFQRLAPITVTDNTGTHTTVYAFRPDGRMLTFTLYSGVYNGDPDVPDQLTTTAGGYRYQTADDTIETYNASGQLQSIAARGQAPLTLTYDIGGFAPTAVADAFGHQLQFTYIRDSAGHERLQTMTDPAGKTITYVVNSSGNLTSVTYPDLSSRSYGYGSSNLLQTLTDEAAVVYATWGYTYATYYYQVTSSVHAGNVDSYTFSYNGSSRTVTDPLGTTRTYTQSLIAGLYHPTGVNQFCAGCDKSRTYDGNSNVASRTDFNNNETTYNSYDLNRNLETSRTEAYGTAQARTITTTWDPSWRQPDLITEPNRTTAFTYNSLGGVLTKTITDTTVTPNVARTWTYTYDSYGRMLTAKGPRTDVNSTTTYAYYTCTTGTQCGEIQTLTDALGHVTTFNTYNAHGQPLTITDPNGTVTTLTYDLRQRLLSRQVGTETTSYSYYPTGLLKLVTMPDSSTILYTYDNAHRLTTITDGVGNYISYTLDAMGNPTAIKTYDPSSTLHRTHTRVFNALNEFYQDVNAAGTSAVTTTYGYDSNGNQTSIAAPLSRNTADQYDALNRLTQITDPNSGITKLGYDANDNLASVKDPRSLTTSYIHNGFGDVTQLVSPDTGTATSTYDSGGNLSTTKDARSALGTYSYDALNRVTKIAYSDQTISLTYDSGTNGIGRLTGASDANHSLSWTYDTLGRVTGKGQIVAGVTKSVGYSHTNGDLITLVTPSGQTVTYGYNNHRVTSIAVNSTTVLSGVTYDPFGPATGWTWGNSTSVSRAYDQDGNPHQIVTAGVTDGYTVDSAQRITGLSDSGLASNSFTFGYDLLDRVTSGSSSALTRGYTYDANSNRLTETGTVAYTASITSINNQIVSTTGGIVRTYGYDAAGNTTGYGSNSYSFNQRGRMSRATVSGGTTNYVYNALGQLIEKSGNGATALLVYDEAGHLLGEYSSTGALIEETIWMGNLPVATLRPNGSTGCTSTVCVFYVHTDHLGTPRKVTRPSDNALMWRWDPDTFGSVAPNQNPGGIGTYVYSLRFPGQYYMAETGLFYNYHRDYDPQMGRYLESDPLGLAADNPSTYAYANGNPMSYTDPFGLDVTITITRQGISSTGLSIPGTINATSTVTPLSPINGSTIENAQAGDNGNKPPIPAGSYDAFIRTDHDPNRIELSNVPGYSNVQIHPGSYPRNFKGCFGAGNSSSLDFLGGTVATQNQILALIAADGSGNITVNVSPVPLGPVLPATTTPFGLPFP